ncbi:MAG TPA: hypothetical protein ENK67_01340 [Flavobacteriia bacterium]|jgi:hypothetical protein|nr:hypothetical protein [Flavobacteriia bacterium]
MYKFRIILDINEQDVIREIAIAKDFTLEELHITILNAFGFEPIEMASFYYTDEEWHQQDEIPLFNMNDQIGGFTQMRDYKLDFIFNEKNNKMLYVYDFFNLWTFFVEFLGDYNTDEDKEIPLLLFSLGEVPKEAPKKEFEPKPEEECNDEFDIFDGDDSFNEFY